MSTFSIAYITSAHGIRGEVKLRVLLENPKHIERYNPLTDKTGRTYRVKVTGVQKELVIASIEGITDRNQSELLRGTELLGDVAKLPKTSENEFFEHELVGMNAVSENGDVIGTIKAIQNYGAGDIIEIKMPDEEIMLPFQAPFIGNIDKKAKTIVVTLPEYMDDKS